MKYSYLFNTLTFLLLISSSNCVLAQNAKRAAPKEVQPIVIGQVKYTAPTDSMGYIVAFDIATNKWLWSVKIYTVKYDLRLETDVQHVFIDSLYTKENKLYIHNERKRIYALDLLTRKTERMR